MSMAWSEDFFWNRGRALHPDGSFLRQQVVWAPPQVEGSEEAGGLVQPPRTTALPIVWRPKVPGQSLERSLVAHGQKRSEQHRS